MVGGGYRVVGVEFVAIEWSVAVALDVRIFALLFLAAIVRKFVTPAIGDHVEDFVVGWQRRQRARLAGCFGRRLRGEVSIWSGGGRLGGLRGGLAAECRIARGFEPAFASRARSLCIALDAEHVS